MGFTQSDLKQKRKELGYNDDISRTLYVESLKKTGWVLGAYAGLFNKYYAISFEKDGLLFMGMNITSQFTDNDFFLPLSKLQTVNIKKARLIEGNLSFNTSLLTLVNMDGEKQDYKVYDWTVGKSGWMKEYRSNAENMIEKYPSLADSQRHSQSSNKSYDNLDKIAKLKSLLDDGAITQEEYDAKKKELLGL